MFRASVMRQLGEQLVDALHVHAGETACDLLCDGGTLTAMLAARRARVMAADVSPQLTAAAAAESADGDVAQVTCDGLCVDLPDASCDAVASLLTLGFGEVDALLGEPARLLRSGGRAALGWWDPEDPPAHLAALRRALRNAGHESPFLAACLPEVRAGTGWSLHSVSDVARFDGPAHVWSAVVEDTHLHDELAALSDGAAQQVREELDAALSRYQAADGTMRIPVIAQIATA